ncbi:hypothetical protein [Delftia sp. PS-11]|uniref:hypothetical protein n=1 Tax=Delftia sp. PS-11 TaxID=2767222 RepID=UPI00245488DF|nr:hypothetical protein [Delftia sp. PS-11]KAJ8745428.1 hypothetical protein H9T68_06410 [Delftia sp. PS-11]
MQVHIIEDGVVVNTIIATVAEAEAAYPDAVCIDAEQHAGGVGWLWDGHALTPPPPAPDLPPPVPDSCSKRQGELVLLTVPMEVDGQQLTVLHWLEAKIAAEPDPIEKRRMQAELGAATWERANPFLQQIWAALGHSQAELDELFRRAVTL